MSLRGGESWTLTRRANGAFSLEEEQDWQADELIVNPMLDALGYLTAEETLTENPEEYADRLREFGLEEPEAEAAWTLDTGESFRMRIGDELPADENHSYYMLLDGDDRLFSVSAGTLQDLRVEKALLHPVTQPVIHTALLDRITVIGENGETRLEWALQGQVTDQDAPVNWRVRVPFDYPMDEDVLQGLLKNAGNLRLGVYLAEDTEQTRARYGIRENGSALILHFAAGSTGTVTDEGVYDVTNWEEETLRFLLGEELDGMNRAVCFEGKLYSVGLFSLNAFLETDPMSTTARYPVLTPLNSLDSMTVETEAGTDVYRLERETDENGETGLRVLKNGAEVSAEAFEAAYQRLLTVDVSGRLPADAVWGSPHTKYTFRTVSGGTHTVELSDYDGFHDAVTVDGGTLFYLIRNSMQFQ